jgi:hypothetical protein
MDAENETKECNTGAGAGRTNLRPVSMANNKTQKRATNGNRTMARREPNKNHLM